MELVMCRACGEFVTAIQKNGTFESIRPKCPACGGAGFKHNATGTTTGTDH